MPTRTVTGTYLDGALRPLSGRLHFRPATRVVTDTAILLPERIVVGLDSHGSFTVTLQTTADGAPPAWVWKVTEKFGSSESTWLFDLPEGDGPLDLADVSPISPAPGEWQYEGPKGDKGDTGPTGPMGSWC